jgi:hypothetical protein
MFSLRLAVLFVTIYKYRIRDDKGDEVCSLPQSPLVNRRNEIQDLLLILHGPAISLFLSPRLISTRRVDKAWPVRPSAFATR